MTATTSAPALRAARMSARMTESDSGAAPARADEAFAARPIAVVAQDGEPRPGDREPCRPARRREVATGAEVPDPDPVEVAERLEHARTAVVADVVVGQRHRVDAGALHACQQPRIHGEDQPEQAVGGIVGRRTLEVDDGDVRTPDQRPHGTGRPDPLRPDDPHAWPATADARGDPGEAAVPRIVDPAAFADRPLVDGPVQHHVAARHQRPDRIRVERSSDASRVARRRAAARRRGP